MTRITHLTDDDILTSAPRASTTAADDTAEDVGPTDTAADPDTATDTESADDTSADPGPSDTGADPDSAADR